MYRWTDESGRVHYGDRPPQGEGTPVELDAAHEPTSESSGAEAHPIPRERLLRAFEKERRERRERARRRALEQEARAQRCATARDNLHEIQSARYLYEGEGEQRLVLSEEERRDVTEQWREAVRRWCD